MNTTKTFKIRYKLLKRTSDGLLKEVESNWHDIKYNDTFDTPEETLEYAKKNDLDQTDLLIQPFVHVEYDWN